jgi:hypothetical protein
METLVAQKHLLDPMQYGLFAWKLISHKICRWLVPASGILGLIGLMLLAPAYEWDDLLLAAVFLGLAAAAIGALWPKSRYVPRALSILTFAVAANLAVVHAMFRVLHGHEDHLWEPTRRAPTSA